MNRRLISHLAKRKYRNNRRTRKLEYSREKQIKPREKNARYNELEKMNEIDMQDGEYF